MQQVLQRDGCPQKDRTHRKKRKAVFRKSLTTVSPNCAPGRKSVKKHSLSLRETCTEYDETLEVKHQHTTGIQPHGPGRVEGWCHGFEAQLATGIGLRGLHRGEKFELFSNRQNAGNFGNLVYTADGRRYFLQLQHADSRETRKLTKGDWVTLLLNSFKSYCDIKRRGMFKDTQIYNSQFIIYTNKELKPKLLRHKRRPENVYTLYETRDKVKIFSFSPDDKNKESDVYTLLENSVKGKNYFYRSRDRKLVSQFLNEVIIVASQKGTGQLVDEMCKEIEEHDAVKVAGEMYKEEVLYLQTRVANWLKKGKESMTAEMFRIWLQEAKTKACFAFIRSMFVSCTKELVTTGIHFTDSEISLLQTQLSDKRAVHLRSDGLAICKILLMQCLPVSKCIFVNFKSLQRARRKLLHAWFGGVWQWCVVICDSNIQRIYIKDIFLNMFRSMNLAVTKKRLIILTPDSVQEIRGFTTIDHLFTFEDLSQKSQEMVLYKKVDFQGLELPVKSILDRHGIMEYALGAGMISRLVTVGTVELGGRLHTNRGYYAPRVLEREVWLQLDVLRNPDMYPDMCAVSGVEVKDLATIVPAGETVEYIDQQNIHHRDFTQGTRSRFVVLLEADAEICFLELCKKHTRRTLHWVQFKNGNLLWKKTHGDSDKLLNYIDTERTRLDKMCVEKYMRRGTCEVNEKAIWDLGERTVLVVAEPGMGKSSTTTQVAWNTKLADPTSWVVRINWNDHSKELQKIIPAAFNFDSLVDFLCSVAFPESKYRDFNRSLLEQALQYSGNITVLMDWFDKISPNHAHKAAVILSELMKTKVRRVWVTSRPVQRERLEKVLSVAAFTMKKLSNHFQVKILLKLWMPKNNPHNETCVAFINHMLILVNHSVNDSNFTGSPPYIKMIVTAVNELDVERWIRFRFSKLPRDIDLFRLYEKYFERKLHSYLTEEKRVDITNDNVLDSHERLKEHFLEDLEKCALIVILPYPMLESLHNKKTEEEIQPFLVKVEAEKDKKVAAMLHSKPKFVKSALAKYLTARWFSRNFEFNRSVLERILFDPEYSFVRDMFDRLLAKDCPLHGAVIEREEEVFESLLERCEISAVDKGGRTVMHIIATRDCTFLNIINRVFPHETCLHYTDSVLQWTPLQYAIKSEKWFIVERLLENRVDRSGLDMIRQRAQDTDYIDPIVIHAAVDGHLLLLEFLCSIGVNIHQASSTSFPSPLHAAIEGQQLKVVKWLIQHGADCNTRYSDGKTPLFHAVTEGSLDVVQALVEEGGASMDVRDDDDRTVIDWMYAYVSDPKNRDDILWKGDVERLNEIVKYLQERGVESSAVYG